VRCTISRAAAEQTLDLRGQLLALTSQSSGHPDEPSLRNLAADLEVSAALLHHQLAVYESSPASPPRATSPTLHAPGTDADEPNAADECAIARLLRQQHEEVDAAGEAAVQLELVATRLSAEASQLEATASGLRDAFLRTLRLREAALQRGAAAVADGDATAAHHARAEAAAHLEAIQREQSAADAATAQAATASLDAVAAVAAAQQSAQDAQLLQVHSFQRQHAQHALSRHEAWRVFSDT